MSTHPIDRALAIYKRKAATKPDGTHSLDECASRWRVSPDQARKTLGEMKAAKLVSEVAGKKVSGSGQVVSCTYYRFNPAGDR